MQTSAQPNDEYEVGRWARDPPEFSPANLQHDLSNRGALFLASTILSSLHTTLSQINT